MPGSRGTEPEALVPSSRFFRLKRLAWWLWVSAAILIALSASEARRRGPLRQWQPRTILSLTGTDPKTADEALEFLHTISSEIPSGDTVAFVWAGHRTRRDDENSFLTAIGQLPAQRVLAPWALDPAVPPGRAPEFVASFGGEFLDSRYHRIHRFPGGDLYRWIVQ